MRHCLVCGDPTDGPWDFCSEVCVGMAAQMSASTPGTRPSKRSLRISKAIRAGECDRNLQALMHDWDPMVRRAAEQRILNA